MMYAFKSAKNRYEQHLRIGSSGARRLAEVYEAQSSLKASSPDRVYHASEPAQYCTVNSFQFKLQSRALPKAPEFASSKISERERRERYHFLVDKMFLEELNPSESAELARLKAEQQSPGRAMFGRIPPAEVLKTEHRRLSESVNAVMQILESLKASHR